MSVQLILYPQSHNGLYNSYSVPYFNEHLGNPKFTQPFFVTTNNPLAIANFYGHNPVDRLDNVGHANNTWSSWYTDGNTSPTTTSVFGAVSAPTISGGICTLHSTASGADGFDTGIYQRVQNLTAGISYNLKIQILEATSGTLTIGHPTNWQYNFLPNGAGVHPIILNNQITPTVGTQTFTFTATDSQEMLVLRYTNSVADDLVLGEVSIKENITSAPTVDAYTDGQVILDLYEESNLPLSLSIDNFKNVAEKTQSFSKAFKLPSTKRNNKIFSNLFDVTRSSQSDAYAFNPYKKTKAILKEDGYTVFDGYLRLIDITETEQEISYNVNLYSDTLTLAETLKNKTFQDLDFSELNHIYDKSNIKLSTYDNNGVTLTNDLSTSSFAYDATFQSGNLKKTDVIKYPFVKWNGDSYLDAGNVTLEKLEDAFRPFINCKYLVDRIISEAGFTYNSDFLESTDFTKLYMDFNWGEGLTPAGFSDTLNITTTYTPSAGDNNINFDTGQIPPHYNTSTKKITADENNLNFSGTIALDIIHTGTSSTATETLAIQWLHKDSSGNFINSGQNSHSIVYTGSIYPQQCYKSYNVTLNDGDTLEFRTWVASSASQITIIGSLPLLDPLTGTTYDWKSTLSVNTSSEISMIDAITKNRGNLGQWEFIKGFVSMFNLMILQDKDNPTNFIIEPYKSVFVDDSLSSYITHKTHDWTIKVDANEMKLKPIELKKNILLEHAEEDKDYAKGVYKATTGYAYGDKEVPATTFNLLEGETKVTTPFASTFVKPIFEGFNEMIIPVAYTAKDDGTFTGYENKPRILYNNGRVTMSSKTYYIPAQNGLASENQSSYLQFSHLSAIPTTISTKDYNFETGQLITVLGNPPVDNLFNTYWQPYYDELYNSDTKTMSLKVYLTPSEISNFNFYDKVRIKNSLFRVNKIDYKPYEMSTVEFILIA